MEKSFRYYLLIVLTCVVSVVYSLDIQKLVNDSVNKGYAPGIVIAYIDSAGIRYYAAGKLSVESTQNVDENTLFEIGSVTKPITALMFHEMVANGELNYHDAVDSCLPQEVQLPSWNGKKIHFYHLLTHTAGFPYMPDNFMGRDMKNPFANYTTKDLYEYLNAFAPAVEPGTKHEYSNLSMGLLGHILALKNKMSYEELVIKKICEPLNMSSTRITLTDEMKARFAKGHVGNKIVPNWDIPTLEGAGALKSCAKDLAQFVAANLGIINTHLFPYMLTMRPQQCATKDDFIGMTMGFNTFFRYSPNIIWHNGSTGGYHSFIGFCPEKQVGVVVLSNSITYTDDIGRYILDDRYEITPMRKEIPLNPVLLNRYAGEYKHYSGVRCLMAVEDGKLKAKLTGQPAVNIYPETETNFFCTAITAQAHFQLDESDNVKGFYAIYGAQSFWFKKLD